MKIILNKCYGGFGLSKEAYELYAKKKGLTVYPYYNSYEDNFTTFKKGDASFLTYYFIKDFGDSVESDKIDWETNLHLNCKYRDDPTLIEVVKELGLADEYSKLFDKERMDKVVKLREESDLDLFLGMDINLQESAARRIAELINANERMDYNYLRTIKEKTGIDIEAIAKELKELHFIFRQRAEQFKIIAFATNQSTNCNILRQLRL